MTTSSSPAISPVVQLTGQLGKNRAITTLKGVLTSIKKWDKINNLLVKQTQDLINLKVEYEYADSPFWGRRLRERKDIRLALQDKILLKLERLNSKVIATFLELTEEFRRMRDYQSVCASHHASLLTTIVSAYEEELRVKHAVINDLPWQKDADVNLVYVSALLMEPYIQSKLRDDLERLIAAETDLLAES